MRSSRRSSGGKTAPVSVLIPTMDRPERLRRALESVSKQTVKPAEVLVIDGSATDQAKSIIDEFDLNITYVRQHGRGLSNARNLGIEESSKEYIAFLDDDDWWAPEKLERQLQKIRTEDVGFVFTGINHTGSTGETINVHKPNSAPDSKEILSRNRVGAPSTVLVQSDSLNKIGGFDEDLATREEWDLYIRLLQNCSAAVIPTPLTYKEAQEDSISRDTSNLERDWPKILDKHSRKYDDATRQEFHANFQFELGRSQAKNGNFSTARKHFVRSLLHQFEPRRVGYLFVTILGKDSYRFATKIYRKIKNT
ncbi:glycosyltransferase family 2 protein [Halocatena halophila]|uniref:glycosyltransferase family 2 protein n=1 Tax=Halocatena halophila TaxID=2814576 RepID=UPI002ED420C8